MRCVNIFIVCLLGFIAAQRTVAETADPLLMAESKLPPKKAVQAFGQRIAYYDVGTGPVLVLVHGFGTEARFDWGNVILPLAKNHRVIALDQIGFGASDKPLIDYSVQTFVDFLGEFLRVLQVKQFSLVGESLGGQISALYTIESLAATNTGPFPLPKPMRLVLQDAAGMAAPHLATILAGTLADVRGVAVILHDKSRVNDELVRELFIMRLKANDGATQRSLAANPKVASEVVAGRLSGIDIPTLIIWGADDEIVPLEQGRAYAAGILGATLKIIPDCGHAPSLEKPEAFLAAVLPFLPQ